MLVGFVQRNSPIHTNSYTSDSIKWKTEVHLHTNGAATRASWGEDVQNDGKNGNFVKGCFQKFVACYQATPAAKTFPLFISCSTHTC